MVAADCFFLLPVVLKLSIQSTFTTKVLNRGDNAYVVVQVDRLVILKKIMDNTFILCHDAIQRETLLLTFTFALFLYTKHTVKAHRSIFCLPTSSNPASRLLARTVVTAQRSPPATDAPSRIFPTWLACSRPWMHATCDGRPIHGSDAGAAREP
jgi:hypothetical protein